MVKLIASLSNSSFDTTGGSIWGGKEGTLKDWYKDPDGPYLFGKTGSLSNNHNLCGYLRTKSGKTVVFSFMNNHYRKPTTLVKSRMQRLLIWVREHY